MKLLLCQVKKKKEEERQNSALAMHSLQPLLNVLHWKKKRRNNKNGAGVAQPHASPPPPSCFVYLNVNGYEVLRGLG